MEAQRVKRPSREEVRQRLLKAAADVLVSHGYGAASVDLITEAAGLSRGALYSNFADKENLYLALLDEQEQREIHELHAIYVEHGDLNRFLDVVTSRGTSPTRDARAQLILQVELWLLSMRNPAVRERMIAIQRRTIAAIAGAVSTAQTEFSNTELASVVSAIADGLLMQRMLDPDHLHETILVDTLRFLARLIGLLPSEGVPT
jgi:AcrR family transcriptional regulator